MKNEEQFIKIKEQKMSNKEIFTKLVEQGISKKEYEKLSTLAKKKYSKDAGFKSTFYPDSAVKLKKFKKPRSESDVSNTLQFISDAVGSKFITVEDSVELLIQYIALVFEYNKK